MVSLTLEKEKLKKTYFVDLKELFDYAIDNKIISYDEFIIKKDITYKLHDLENEADLNSKVYNNVDDLFDDLEK